MNLRPSGTVSKALISSPSSFLGEFEMDGLVFAQASQGFGDQSAQFKRQEGPASRSSFVLSFATAPVLKQAGVLLPNYSFASAWMCSWLSMLFGKRFDDHGLIESLGFFYVPAFDSSPVLSRHTLPHNSRSERASYPVPLDLREIRRIQPLLEDELIVTPAYLQALRTAAKFYSQALRSFETDPEVAYLHLVTSIEVLSSQTDLSKLSLYDAETSHYLGLIEGVHEDGPKIARHFRGRLLSVKRKFVGTVCELVQDDFFLTSEFEQAYGRFKRDSFEKCIGAAYDLRSHYVHTGAPFGSWVTFSSAGENADVQGGAPYGIDKDFAKILAKAPTLVGLERVVRHCLLRSAELNALYLAPNDEAPAPNPTAASSAIPPE